LMYARYTPYAVPRTPTSPLLPTRRSSDLEQAQQVYEEISQQHDALAAELEVQQDTVERLRAHDGELEGRIQTLDSMLNSAFQLADRKSTRLNSSHVSISYAVFCLKKKKRW